jgi:hypothetical protein
MRHECRSNGRLPHLGTIGWPAHQSAQIRIRKHKLAEITKRKHKLAEIVFDQHFHLIGIAGNKCQRLPLPSRSSPCKSADEELLSLEYFLAAGIGGKTQGIVPPQYRVQHRHGKAAGTIIARNTVS